MLARSILLASLLPLAWGCGSEAVDDPINDAAAPPSLPDGRVGQTGAIGDRSQWDLPETPPLGSPAAHSPLARQTPGPRAQSFRNPPAPVLFADRLEGSGITLDRVAADGLLSVVDRMSGGVCVLDADGLPPLDLFFAVRAGPSDTRSRLYIAEGDWSYRDATDTNGLGAVGDAVGCLAFDYDADGDDDLLVTGVGLISFYENDEGSFLLRSDVLGYTPEANDMYTSAAAGDIDQDGDLDLLIGGLLRYEPGERAGMRCGLYPCEAAIYSFPKIPSLLFKFGSGRFHEVGASLAPDIRAAEPTLCVSLGDQDGDGLPNIFIGNDLGATYYNRVLHPNDGGPWIDLADSIGLAFTRYLRGGDTMGFASGDLDNDGDLDHIATSWERDASAVFICTPSTGCEDRARWAGTYATRESLRWGVGMADLDLDGDLDVVEATGHYHLGSELSDLHFIGEWRQPMNVLLNRGDGRMEAPRLGRTDGSRTARPTRGISFADLDDDGRVDVVAAGANGRPALLRNVAETSGAYLQISLVGRGGNRPAAGAFVTVTQGLLSQVREKRLGEGYLGNFDPRLHFGFPSSSTVSVRVRWPDGTLTELADVSLDREITIRQGP